MTQPIIFSILCFVSALAGGFLAMRFKKSLPKIMAFAAGILIGVVFFEIFPEIFEQILQFGFEPVRIMIALVAGFLVFHILEKTLLIHKAHETDYADHRHPNVGVLSAAALIGHGFIDGASIALGFQINSAVGLLVAFAVISHAFTDGMNVVALMLLNRNSTKKARTLLLFDALAPVLGVLVALFLKIPPYFLTLYLGFFAGFLLYIGASDILPEAHSQRSSYSLIGLTILGLIFIFIASRFV